MVVLAVLILLLAGCATVGNPKLMDDQLLAAIQSKQTTQQQVLEWLGEPMQASEINQNGHPVVSWGYGYGHSEVNPLLYVPIVNLVVLACCSISEQDGRSLTLTFTADGLVDQKIVTRHALPIK